ncbi:hypothetical protein A4H97_24310 [Niastella yeongjuensis]|uniref:HTH LytTR-type domain-containing protein n=1 Tax=Niastella yeongjuensis TaxID=354355 RepID=A0A1V9F3J4_9BACT|nr:LytTR family DNA-binding domain-containing protein [Niastella yeongjuensis]OQP52826.1 hypothetical protein A4H97_24310 [Niastella yeongjuensis]SEP20610.1 LytTr DNA-binding domain-containing protein [Niastella yeongjuensis]
MNKKTFFFREDRQLIKVNLDDIFFLAAQKNYTRLYTALDSFHLARITLVEAMRVLPEDKFLRVHRSYAVATDHIEAVKRDAIRLATIDAEVPVSRMYYTAITKQFIILDSADFETGKKKIVNVRNRKD